MANYRCQPFAVQAMRLLDPSAIIECSTALLSKKATNRVPAIYFVTRKKSFLRTSVGGSISLTSIVSNMMSSPEVPVHEGLEVVQHEVYAKTQYGNDQSYFNNQPLHEESQKHRTFCGLRPITFFLLLTILLIILAAAIGGGVGGTMAVKKAKE